VLRLNIKRVKVNLELGAAIIIFRIAKGGAAPSRPRPVVILVKLVKAFLSYLAS